MRTLLIASALSVLAIAPAAAQSCVSGGQFVPCGPAGGMQPGMAGGMSGGMQPGMQGGQSMAPEPVADQRKPARRAKMKKRRMSRR